MKPLDLLSGIDIKYSLSYFVVTINVTGYQEVIKETCSSWKWWIRLTEFLNDDIVSIAMQYLFSSSKGIQTTVLAYWKYMLELILALHLYSSWL